jgi:hypothetical protein
MIAFFQVVKEVNEEQKALKTRKSVFCLRRGISLLGAQMLFLDKKKLNTSGRDVCSLMMHLPKTLYPT